jgi:2-dehydropantoate 2-reductase
MNIHTVLIAGAGAVGLTVASQIYRYDPSAISILAKGERLERYRRDGLFVNSVRTGFQLADAEQKPAQTPDLIIIACKNHHLPQLVQDMQHYVGEQTLILSLLNGITSEEIIGTAFGAQRIPYAMIIATDAQHSDGATLFTLHGTINFGEKTNPSSEGKETSACSERVRSIAAFFTRCGIAYTIPQDMIRTLWYKFMVNTGINQTSAILRLPYGPFQNNGKSGNIPEARELMEAAMHEVISISQAEGTGLTEEDIGHWYETLNALTPDSRTSMCQDVMAERKTEVELFAAEVVSRGKKHGIPVPVNEMLWRLLRVIEQSYDQTHHY